MDGQTGDEERRAAAAALGRARTPAKAAAARENAKKGGRAAGSKLTPEHRAALAEAQKRRWARVKGDTLEAGTSAAQEDGEERHNEPI